MFEPVKIAPSILSADFMHLGRDIELIEKAGAGYVHVDVMDGHFVPNLTMGVPVVKQLKKATRLPLDVHLMIANPLEQLPWFLDAGGRQRQAPHGGRRAGAGACRSGHGAGHERRAGILRAELHRGQRG